MKDGVDVDGREGLVGCCRTNANEYYNRVVLFLLATDILSGTRQCDEDEAAVGLLDLSGWRRKLWKWMR